MSRREWRQRARLEDLPEVMSTEDIAALLGVSLPVARRLVKDGAIRRLPMSGRHIRVLKEEVMRYLRDSMEPL